MIDEREARVITRVRAGYHNGRMITRILLLMALCGPTYGATTILRMSCGGSGGTDTGGNVWAGDTGAVGGYAWTAVNQPELAQQDVPYRSLRASSGATSFTYTLTFQPGTYNVTLKYLEPNKTAIGQRIFQATISPGAGTPGIDLFKLAGGKLKPYDTTYQIITPDGKIVIAITGGMVNGVATNGVLSGIQVDLVPPPSPVTSFLTLTPTHVANIPHPAAPNVQLFSNADNMGKIYRMDSAGNLYLIEGSTPQPGGPNPAVLSGMNIPSPSGGDTQQCALVSAAIRPGNFNGGSIICQYNDGHDSGAIGLCQGGGGGNSIAIYSLDVYDKSNVANVKFTCINPMTSYGAYAATSCYDGQHQMKSRKPFALNGWLYLPIFCMNGPTPVSGQPWEAFQSGIAASPDGGAHWCNAKTYAAGGNTCTAANWKADGDNPVDAAGFQWPVADGTNRITRMQLIDYMCADNAVNCPTSPAVDSNHLYFFAVDSLSNNTTLMRVAKTANVMLPTSYEYFNLGFWSTQDASNIVIGIGCCGSVSYLKDFGVFAMWAHPSGFFTSLHPAGPWTETAIPPVNPGPPIQGFPAPVPGLCPKYDLAGRVTCTVFESPNTDLHIYEEDLGPLGPPTLVAFDVCSGPATATQDCSGLYRAKVNIAAGTLTVVGVAGVVPDTNVWVGVK